MALIQGTIALVSSKTGLTPKELDMLYMSMGMKDDSSNFASLNTLIGIFKRGG